MKDHCQTVLLSYEKRPRLNLSYSTCLIKQTNCLKENIFKNIFKKYTYCQINYNIDISLK